MSVIHMVLATFGVSYLIDLLTSILEEVALCADDDFVDLPLLLPTDNLQVRELLVIPATSIISTVGCGALGDFTYVSRPCSSFSPPATKNFSIMLPLSLDFIVFDLPLALLLLP